MFDKDMAFIAFAAGYELGQDDAFNDEMMDNIELRESFDLWISELEAEASV